MRDRWTLLTPLVLSASLLAACGNPYLPSSPPPLPADSPEFGELGRIAYSRTDKGPRGHNFTEVYERFFSPLRGRPISVLEIGIADGGSLLTWQDYFPQAQVYGIDVLDRSNLASDRIHTFVADQSNREQLGAFLAKHPGPFDVVLDDGGHAMDMQQISLGYLFPHVRPGGFYVVEDVHTSLGRYHGGYGLSLFGGNSTFRVFETFVRTGRFESRYMTREEERYLTEQVEYGNLFVRQDAEHSATWLLRKRAAR